MTATRRGERALAPTRINGPERIAGESSGGSSLPDSGETNMRMRPIQRSQLSSPGECWTSLDCRDRYYDRLSTSFGGGERRTYSKIEAVSAGAGFRRPTFVDVVTENLMLATTSGGIAVSFTTSDVV